MIRGQLHLQLHQELIVDNFAGGGGASIGIELAARRPVDIAINHDPEAVAMHQINHPQTRHYCENVWDVDPRIATNGKEVGLAWFSPDCKHFSKAKGGKPVEKKIRGLAWVVLRWAATVQPRIIMLENVEEFVTWGPLISDGNGGYKPCPKRKGQTFNSFVNALKRHGYIVEWREMRACDYGAPTTRKRLFLIARRDGEQIVWPEPTHGDPRTLAVKAGHLKPWRTAAECIDWSIPCPSIFDRKKPLAEATQRRIARGIKKYVLETASPFIVGIDHQGAGDGSSRAVDQPLNTVTSKARHALVCPTLIQTGYGEREGQAPRVPGLDKPLGTIVAGGTKHALVSAFLAKHYGGNYDGAGLSLDEPAHTVTSTDHHALVAAHLVRQFGTSNGAACDSPVGTIMPAGCGKTQLVKAFLVKYYGTGGQDQNIGHPMHTLTAKARMGLVTVKGAEYFISDIGMRMLKPPELYKAQGFPDGYQIAPIINGKRLSETAQTRMCGNSVSPVLAEALVKANYQCVKKQRKQA